MNDQEELAIKLSSQDWRGINESSRQYWRALAGVAMDWASTREQTLMKDIVGTLGTDRKCGHFVKSVLSFCPTCQLINESNAREQALLKEVEGVKDKLSVAELERDSNFLCSSKFLDMERERQRLLGELSESKKRERERKESFEMIIEIAKQALESHDKPEVRK